MVRKTSNEALCSPFIAKKQYEHFSFPTSGRCRAENLSGRLWKPNFPTSARPIWPDVGKGGPTSESTLPASIASRYPSGPTSARRREAEMFVFVTTGGGGGGWAGRSPPQRLQLPTQKSLPLSEKYALVTSGEGLSLAGGTALLVAQAYM